MSYLVKLSEDRRKNIPDGESRRNDVWMVGTYEPFSTQFNNQGVYSTETSYNFVSLFAFKTARSAIMMINYLNGGNEPTGGLKTFLEQYIATE